MVCAIEHDLDETIALWCGIETSRPLPFLNHVWPEPGTRVRAHAVRQTKAVFTKELGVLSTRSFEIDGR
jgi:hypothetical protein